MVVDSLPYRRIAGVVAVVSWFVLLGCLSLWWHSSNYRSSMRQLDAGPFTFRCRNGGITTEWRSARFPKDLVKFQGKLIEWPGVMFHATSAYSLSWMTDKSGRRTYYWPQPDGTNTSPNPPPVDFWILTVSFWWILGASALGTTPYFIASWFHRKRQLHEASGTCIACGYDLRASSYRCPECGTEIPVGLNR